MESITPLLLESVRTDFLKSLDIDKKYLQIVKALEKNPSWENANKYAIRIGELLSDSLVGNITSDVLPNGRFYFNIADEILRTTLSIDYDLVSDVAEKVQRAVNERAGIGLKPLVSEFNESRTKGIIDKASNAEQFTDVEWVLKEPIVNYSQAIVDDTIKENAKFHARAGLRVNVERIAEATACPWCLAIAGTYNVDRAFQIPHEVFQRHERCRCELNYNSVKLNPYRSPSKLTYNTFRE